MIYFTTHDEGKHVIILEPDHLDSLKKGESISSPNKEVLIMYSPDAQWLGEQILANVINLTPEFLDKLVAESQLRPEKRGRPFFPTVESRTVSTPTGAGKTERITDETTTPDPTRISATRPEPSRGFTGDR